MPPKKSKKQKPFNERLILNQFFIQKIFGVETFEKLSDELKNDNLELLDADNISNFHHAIKARFADGLYLFADDLLRYDQNIVRYTQELNRHRKQPIRWKYFQYLSLLFTEIFLDLWTNDETEFLKRLNWLVGDFNTANPNNTVNNFAPADLRKLAFWNATGSGKTLLMHVNIWQIKHYWAKRFPTQQFDQIILLTPNEGLSRQHLDEFEESGIDAELFDKNAGRFRTKDTIQIIEIYKLKKEGKEKTVSIDAFEGTNLVFVDEGHRGASGEEYLPMRKKLADKGFAFEYSATFGQAVKASKSDELAHEYSKAILFDYSYKYFYEDGYGKDFRILNFPDSKVSNSRHEYLIASLLTFYQQMRLFEDKGETLKPFNLEKPLAVFVGGSVTKATSQKDISDAVDILLFLAIFIQRKSQSVSIIKSFLDGRANLLDEKGHNIFANSFGYLIQTGRNAEDIFNDMLLHLFNAQASAMMRVENLSKFAGEIALSVGENEPFGVVNVGDDTKLVKMCEKYPDLLNARQRDFAHSLFDSVNEDDSTINFVIGSRKFSEGWNSWRVSIMGLMNIGKTEGSQIIQLFGRGVRLKGYLYSLKRSRRLENKSVIVPRNIELLETLNVFGLQADYMEQFKEYLEAEGLPTETLKEIILPVVTLEHWQKKRLKMIRIKEGGEFNRQTASFSSEVPTEFYGKKKIKVDTYPKIQAIDGFKQKVTDGTKNTALFEDYHIAFMNLDEIFLELQAFKNERGWFNFSISKNEIRELLLQKDWYELLMPQSELLTPLSFNNQRRWQETATSLLKNYIESYYKANKNEYEKSKYEYYELDPQDKNFIDSYRIIIEESQTEIAAKLEELKTLIESRQLLTEGKWQFNNLTAIGFNRHLYLPLLACEGKGVVKISPVSLNEGERDFVEDLQNYCERKPDYFKPNERELYLLRNQSRGRGVGFFEAGNFYPDFILWILRQDKQFVSFIDPKGILNLEHGIDNPKIKFHKSVKELEKNLHSTAPDIVLNSFIISNTFLNQISWRNSLSKNDFEKNHVFFQKEDKNLYIEKILQRIEI
jgi:Type III restriction enzyme, res subunit